MKKALLVLLMMVLAMALLVACGNEPATDGGEADGGDAAEKLDVAFVYNGVVGDAGWIYGHDKGRQMAAEECADIANVTFLESVNPGSDAERVIKDLAAEGYDIIFCASADFEADVKAAAEEYPDCKYFIACGNYSNGNNVESFYPRTPQLWYILGHVAAMLPDVDTIGMVGSVITPSDLQRQNAFLLGAQRVNPEIKENLIYINSYYDPGAEREAAMALIDAGVDVIAQATNTPQHVEVAQEMGKYAMSQYEDMSQYGPDAYVSGEVLVWGAYYVQTIQAIADGSWVCQESGVNSPDITTGVMELANWGPMVTDEMKAAAEAAIQECIDDPDCMWMGPIYDTEGNLRVAEGEYLDPADVAVMDWWVAGTVGAN